jgi:hypothetical protein
MRTCHRGKTEGLDKAARRNSQTRNRAKDEFCTTWREFCTTPGAKFRQFRPTLTHELAISKQLARARWGETRRVSLHEKKKKISLVQNARHALD